MKPIKLEISGLQSFLEKQIIDFTELTSFGLFGIFGETGSGKSTILDAMILAIYGVIPRTMGRKDNGIRPCLNNDSDKISVYFKFKLGNDTFEITREYKKKFSRKGEEKFETLNPLLKINNDIVADTVKNVDFILKENFGISVEDFTRSVVLPQGKFSEFLKLKSIDRITMLENIFNLKKYGSNLQEKLKDKFTLIKEQINALDNQIKGKGDISLDRLNNYKDIEKEKINELNITLDKKSALEKEFSILKEIKLYSETIEEYDKKLDILSQQNETIKNNKLQVEQHNCAIIFRERLKDIDNLKIDIKNQNELKEIEILTISNLNTELKKINCSKISIEIELKDILHSLKKINFSIGELDNIRKLFEIGTILNFKIEDLQKQIKISNKLEENLSIKKDDLFINKNILKKLIENYNNLENHDENMLYTIKEEIITLKNQLKENQIKKDKLEEHYLNLNKETILQDSLNKDLENLNNEINTIENNIKDNILGTLGEQLKDNCPCPLCGSNIHPQIAKKVEFKENKSLNTLVDTKNKIEKNLALVNSNILVLNTSIATIGDLIPSILIEKKILSLEESFKFLENKFNELKLKEIEMNKNIINHTKNIEHIETLIENFQKDIKTSKISYDEINIEINKIKNDNNIKENINLNKILEEKTQLELKEKEQRELFSLKIELENKINSLNLKIKDIENNIKLHIQKNEQINEILEIKLMSLKNKDDSLNIDSKKSGFENIINISEKILTEVDLKAIEEDIKEFQKSLIKYTSLKDEALKQLNNRSYDNVLYEDRKNMLNDIYLLETNINSEKTQIETKIKILEKAIEEVKDIIIKKDRLIKELDNVELLRETLKGKKFVKFLARKKLDYIVFQASKRLRKITRGRYSLSVNQNCDFNIIDAFNGNSIRDSSTLSGGETFIVSLVLALALSNQLQLKGNIQLEFFFLDEGFGTLDSDLLDRVISILEDIKGKEKISIGIISHVEDLKIRIPRRLEVSSAIPGERGSLIKLI
ncbi:SMC family ATPase [uncultured Cetobacterium sp.]|uniref:AAA family ATPase n=1 Tax=uncultured Cetobacterium sp. TaxID=527638 RepID=UPI0026090866|nr:SMC family ATPase [uncultured Cetobacterium sp.]